MKRSLALLLPLALAACQDANQPLAPSASAGDGPLLQQSLSGGATERIVAGEVLIKLRDGAALPEVAKAYGLALDRVGYKGAFAVFQGAKGNERLNADRLARDPRVVYAEPNYLRQPTVDGRLWAFYNAGNLTVDYFNDSQGRTGPVTSFVSKADADEDIGPDVASDYAAGGADVTIGSIDTGVDFNHPELQGRLIAGKDWYDNDNDPSDTPDEGHGTHTTGTMAGLNVGVAGASGAASHITVYVQRVCGANGCPTSAIVNAINAAADYVDANGNHLVAINLSLGGTFESSAEKTAISNATSKGVLVIASAGNDGTNRVSCPACDSNAISVSATNWQDGLAYYSNYGSGLDISAPGGQMYSNTTPESGILSSVPGNYAGTDAVAGPISGAKYAYFQGTSMAAPQVTGTAGIVASKTGLRGSSLRSRLQSTADDLGAAGYDLTYGNGRLNSYRAVTSSSGGGGSTPPPSTCTPKGKSRKC